MFPNIKLFQFTAINRLQIVESNLREETLLYSSVIQQNKLLKSIKGITILGSFKRAIKKWLMVNTPNVPRS